MTIPSNIDDANSLRFRQNDREGQVNLRYSDSEMKDGEIGSRQFVTLVDVIAEGEIAGFPSAIDAGLTAGTNDYNICALKDVFLNNTQVMKQSAPNTGSDDSDFNFGTSTANRPAFIPRFGTSNQTKVQGLLETERDRPVGVTVTVASPQTVTITDTSTEGIRVTLGFPRLQEIEDDGNISGVNVLYGIQVKNQAGTVIKGVLSGGTPYWVLSAASRAIYAGASGQVSGKSTSPYFKDHIIFIPEETQDSDFPLTVTVTRTSADSTDSRIIDAFELTSITELVFDPSAFPNTALAALRFDAEIFRSIPRRTYRVRGRKVSIPHNATVRSDGSLSFSGTFNGSLKAAKEYCSDPAWILYDLLTETRAGFGDFVAATEVDKYDLYNASVYNSELINNFQGGTSPRFSCHTVIQQSTEAYTLLNKIASVMRANLYIDNGVISLVQDRPTTSTYFFSYANITEDGFVYTGASQRTRDTVVNVKYFDNNVRSYNYETVEDTALQAKYGIVIKNIEAVGCSDRAQARRMGLWHIYTQNNETETVTFATTADAGSLIRPSQIITIQDPVRSNLRRSGRINAATTTQITVDDSLDLPTSSQVGDQLSVILSDGSLETKTVASISGLVITVSSAFSSAPQTNAMWLLEREVLETETFRVLSVKEDNNIYTITALFHNPDKFAFIEQDATLTNPQITNLLQPKDPPTNLQGEEKIIVLNNRAVSKLFFTWQPVAGVSQYSVKYKFNNGNFLTQIVQSPDFEIFDSQLGTYEVEVYSYNALFEPSVQAANLTFNAIGKTAPPANVQNLRIEPINEKLVRLRWDASTDVDVLHGGFCRVRFSQKTDGSGTFSSAVDIDKLAGNSTDVIVPYVEGEYLVRFIDDSNNLSQGSASVVIDLPDAQPALTAQTRREDNDSPKFQGTKTNVNFDSATNSINLIGGGNFDSITDFNTVASLDDFGGIASSGTYDFGGSAGGTTLDLGGVFALDLKQHIFATGFYPNDLIDSRTSLIDTYSDFDGTNATDVNAELQVRFTQDNPSGSPTYTGFQTFVNGLFKGRGFQFRALLTSNDPAQDIKVTELGYTATFQRRTEQSATAISSGAAIKNITFDHPFFVGTSLILGVNSNLPSIGITAQNLGSGEFFEVTNVSSTGFSVHFKNSSNASISRNFNFTAVGFGKGN